jgi:hypothetical protein
MVSGSLYALYNERLAVSSFPSESEKEQRADVFCQHGAEAELSKKLKLSV